MYLFEFQFAIKFYRLFTLELILILTIRFFSSKPGLPAFFDYKVYKQSVHCTHSYLKRCEFCTSCFKKNISFENVYTIVTYGVHNGRPGPNSKLKKRFLEFFKIKFEISLYQLKIESYIFIFPTFFFLVLILPIKTF